MGRFWRAFKPSVVFSMRAFARSRSGNMALIYALSATALLGLLGVTVDFTRAQTLRSQMQNAADGAALVAERSSNETLARRTQLAQAFYDSEMDNQTPGNSFTVTQLAEGGHRVEAGYDMPLTLASIVRNQPWHISVVAEAEAQASPPIEVVMALDNTGSMVNDMQTLRDGANDLSSYLLSISGASVSVGLVPFVAQVNIGTSHTSWMDQTGVNPYNGVMLAGRYLGSKATSGSPAGCTNTSTYPTTYGGFPVRWIQGKSTYTTYNNTSRCYAFSPQNVNMWSLYANLPSNAQWGGCVESRPPPYDISDDPPSVSNGATMFVPYFSLDDGGDVSSPANNWITSTSYDTNNPMGLSGWTANSATHVARTLSVYKYRSGVPVSTSTSNTSGRGPNRGCPTPIVPLTTDKNTLTNAINSMVQWNGGGTNQIEGLAWAWRVISPGPPFTEGRPYNDPANPVRKVIVLFTDGDNTSLDNNNAALESDYAGLGYRSLFHTWQTTNVPTVSGSNATWNPAVSSAYRISGITDSTSAVNYMISRQQQLCTAIKNAGVEIYTVGFRVTAGGTADNLLNSCATQDGSHFYHADNQAELLQVFHAIGSGIGDLRIKH